MHLLRRMKKNKKVTNQITHHIFSNKEKLPYAKFKEHEQVIKSAVPPTMKRENPKTYALNDSDANSDTAMPCHHGRQQEGGREEGGSGMKGERQKTDPETQSQKSGDELNLSMT